MITRMRIIAVFLVALTLILSICPLISAKEQKKTNNQLLTVQSSKIKVEYNPLSRFDQQAILTVTTNLKSDAILLLEINPYYLKETSFQLPYERNAYMINGAMIACRVGPKNKKALVHLRPPSLTEDKLDKMQKLDDYIITAILVKEVTVYERTDVKELGPRIHIRAADLFNTPILLNRTCVLGKKPYKKPASNSFTSKLRQTRWEGFHAYCLKKDIIDHAVFSIKGRPMPTKPLYSYP